jgi:aspartate aminotransferase-like enzyme
MYEDHQSIPYTHSSNLVNALHEALKLVDYENIQSLSSKVRERLRAAGCDLLGDNRYSPGIITIRLPNGISSREFGDQCKKNGILISYESEYLLQRNWVQIALMGAQDEMAVRESLKILERIFASQIRNGYVYETI